MKTLGIAPSLLRHTPRHVYVLALPDLDAFPGRLAIDSPCCVLLLAADFVARPGHRDRLCRRIVDAGCVYFCAWGPGCEQMHDWLDGYIVEREIEGHPEMNICTTWHSADSLADTVEYAVVFAEPADEYAAGCGSVVLVSVGEADWSAQVERAAARHVL